MYSLGSKVEKYMFPYYQRPSKTLDTPIKIYPGEMIEEIGEKYKDRILKPDETYHNEGKKSILLPSVKKKIVEEKIHGYNKKKTPGHGTMLCSQVN